MGTLYFCEKITGSAPTDAVVTWKDGDSTYALRPQPESSSHTPGDTESTKFYDRGTSAALWNIGDNVICKVKSWAEGMELEGDTIREVQKRMPSIPVPEVIHSWLDQAWDRSFLLLRRVSGQSLDEAWTKLSTDQIVMIAEDLANHTITMTMSRSRQLETITGCHVSGEPGLFRQAPLNTWPSWKPEVRPFFTSETLTSYLREINNEDPPHVDEEFGFYHADMGPTNVFVSVFGPEKEDVRITAIIDWEAAAYWPSWYIALKPRVSPGFFLDSVQEEPWKWMQIFSDVLMAAGFDCPQEWYRRAREYTDEQIEIECERDEST
ncbi:hypothetical protein MMC16_006402 [Acarospora aff. strigata]|nr:hypothetical protein [Acarospora aff. strigata]